MRIKPIRTDEDYDEAIVFLRELLALNPVPGTPEDDQIEVLTSLIENYEDDHFPLEQPTAIEAIQFRMEQAGLRQADLVPYIGSPSRASEVLAGKRPLSIEMIRKLEDGLGIPAKVLIQKPVEQSDNTYESWNKKIFTAMKERGYFDGIDGNTPATILQRFFSTAAPSSLMPALHRQSSYRSSMSSNKQAMDAWKVRVLQKAQKIELSSAYKSGSVTKEFMQSFTKLSIKEDGPMRAKQALADIGIALIVEYHLPETRLDGAVLKLGPNTPVIGLTLRHDRIDNFWFTLLHELAHISLHFDKIDADFMDELEEVKGEKIRDVEQAADNLAGEVLVPREKWLISPVRIAPNVIAARNLARELEVDVAIIAGKIRHEHKSWGYMSQLVSERKVRFLFDNDKEST